MDVKRYAEGPPGVNVTGRKTIAGREKLRAGKFRKGEHKPLRSRCQRKAHKRRTGGVK